MTSKPKKSARQREMINRRAAARSRKPKTAARAKHATANSKPLHAGQRAVRALAKAVAPASIATVTPTRWPREIKLDKVIKRRDMGDITGLAKSIDDRGGLISPVCIDPHNFLIAGQRRLAAWSQSQRFCKEAIPVNVLDVDSILAGEWDENAKRKDFTPSESVELMEALLPKAKEAAKARQGHGKTGGRRRAQGEVVPADQKGEAADHVALYLGRDRKTLTRAQEVINAARAAPDDDKLAGLVIYMDKTGKVNGPWKRLQSITQKAAIEDKKASGKLDLPAGKFDRMVADVPWAYEPDGDPDKADTRSVRAYPTMTHKAICALGADIKARTADNCVLFFWVTNYHLVYAFDVLRAWGFQKFPTMLTWRKNKIGRGQWLRDQTEHCIIAVKGKPPWHLETQSTIFDGPRRENSRKPDEFYAWIDQLAPAQRSLELFARRDLPDGWEGFGDQVGTLKADKPPNGSREDSAGGEPNLTNIKVDCRVCSDGNGLCVECLPAESHVVTHTNPNGEAVATCTCRWQHKMPWGGHYAEQDSAIKVHWQTVVDAARQSETRFDVSVTDDARLPQTTPSPESSDSDGLGIPSFLRRTAAKEAAE